ELQIALSAAYTDAQILQDEPKLGAFENDRVPYVARWQAALSAEYSLLVGAEWTVRFGGSFTHVGDRYTAFESNPGAVVLPALNELGLNVSLERERWTARLFATNVTDQQEIVSAGFFGAAINRPRTIGISVDADF